MDIITILNNQLAEANTKLGINTASLQLMQKNIDDDNALIASLTALIAQQQDPTVLAAVTALSNASVSQDAQSAQITP